MAARLSAARARQLGLPGIPKTTAKGRKRDRSTVPSHLCAPNVCHCCGTVLERPVDEDRHLDAHPDHRRYESTLTYRRPRPTGLPIHWCTHCRVYTHSLVTHQCGKRQA